MKLSGTQILAIGAVGVVGYVVVFEVFDIPEKIAAAAKAAGRAVDPTSRDNIFYRGVNAIGDVLDETGDVDDFSLGSAFYDFVQRVKGIPPYDPNAPVLSVASDDVHDVQCVQAPCP